MAPEYIFHSTSFDRELLRKEEICLNDHDIDYQLEIREGWRQARAPLADNFEAEVYINEKDFAKADPLLKDLIQKFS
ncbi:MAG: hypothetical protein IH595_07525 [Bacteroidales bacterium]|nr:hypothetical protein [Bacteroidales bacterium]